MSLVPPRGSDPQDALSRDETIPVLTDVIHLPVENVAVAEPEPEPEPPISGENWSALAARVETGITERMLTNAGPMLDASIDSMLGNLLERAGAQLAQDLHDVFSHLVRDLVARAVAEELALLQARDAALQSAAAPLNRTP